MQHAPRHIRLIAKVVSIDDRNGAIRVHAETSNRYFTVYYEPYKKYCPLKTGDTVDTVVELLSPDELKMVTMPLVTLCSQKSAFEEIVRRAYYKKNFDYRKICVLFEKVSELTRLISDVEPDDVFEIMSRAADTHFKATRKYIPLDGEQPANYEPKGVYADLKKLSYQHGTISRPVFDGDFDVLMEGWINMREMRALYTLGMKKKKILKINLPPHELYLKLKQNPYIFPALSTKFCDDLVRLLRITTVTEIDRQCHDISRYIYLDVKNRGSSCLYLDTLRRRFSYIDSVRPLLENYQCVVVDQRIYPKDDWPETDAVDQPAVVKTVVYLRRCWLIESTVLNALVKRIKDPTYITSGNINVDTVLDVDQQRAVKASFTSNVFILTGPAGSGKTTTSRNIVKNATENEIPWFVCSYTGKAVIRAKELGRLGSRAATMHRMITKMRHIQFKMLIMDEASMTDMEIIYHILMTFTHNFALILIGDVEQLHPIGWGSFFHGCVESRSIPTVRLSSIHRVKTSSGYIDGIVANSTRIATWPDGMRFLFEPTVNFMLMEGNENDLQERILTSKAMGIQRKNIRIVCPYSNEKTHGIESLNKICQLIWGQGKRWIVNPHDRKEEWYIDDIVAMKKNNYDIDVFNGQEGIIVELHDGQGIVVNFPFIHYSNDDEIQTAKYKKAGATLHVREVKSSDGLTETHYDKHVFFPFSTKESEAERTRQSYVAKFDQDEDVILNTKSVKLCDVVSTHGAQGSEWEHTMFYMPPNATSKSKFLCRSIAYVGITRGSVSVSLIGNLEVISEIIRNPNPYRCEIFTHRLKDALPRLHPYVERKLADIKVETVVPEGCDLDTFFDEDY